MANLKYKAQTLLALVDLVNSHYVGVVELLEDAELLRKLFLHLRVDQDALLEDLHRTRFTVYFVVAEHHPTEGTLSQFLSDLVISFQRPPAHPDEVFLTHIELKLL